MRNLNFKNLFATLLTILGLTFGSAAMAGDDGWDDKSGEDSSSGDSYQTPQAGDDSGGDDGWDDEEGSGGDSDW